jgi:N-acetylmuramoyl-L-alanine amidase
MRNIFSQIFIIVIVAISISYAQPPDINVIYPKQESAIGAVDSTFILGSVTRGSKLTVNGYPVDVHKDGGFIAYIPISPGYFVFNLVVSNKTDTSVLEWHVEVPQPQKSFNYDSLRIADRVRTYGNLSLAEGDRLVVEFQATPGCIGYFKIPGYIDSVPVTEIEPQIQPYWGESVFGEGAVPESLKIKGFYRGYTDINDSVLKDSSRIYYYIKRPTLGSIVHYLFTTPDEKIDYSMLSLLNLSDSMAVDSSEIFVKINSIEYPCLVQFTDSVQIMRVGPRKGYYAIFQPEGVRALAVGAEGDWLKLKLSSNQYGWVNKNSVEFLDQHIPPPKSYLRAVRMNSTSDDLTVEFPLSNRHPFRIEEEDFHTISIYLYGVLSDTDWIRYNGIDTLIELADWSQVEPEVYRLRLKFKCPIWGYDSHYSGNILKLQINKPPQDIDKLRDKIIVIDPGHAPGAGAIGPTGYEEKDANLAISLALRKELEKRGATVILTRDEIIEVPLYDRPKIAKAVKADLFISVHNNALPDGVNPFVNNGTSAFYYHSHSKRLAQSIHDEIIDRIKIPSHGIYYGNLAVIRPTQYPAVLIECAFMILPEQEAMLKKKKYQKKFAKSIRKGIEKFLKQYECE